jgi:argininosuccinate synthase
LFNFFKFSLKQANIGQDEDFEAAREKALKLGAKNVIFFYFTFVLSK